MPLKHYIGFILDDHTLFSEALAKILEDYLPFESVFTFTHEKDLIEQLVSLQSSKPLYLFLDYYIGLSTLPSVLSEIRRVSKKHKVIVISSITNPVLLNDLLLFKPDGIIHKSDNTKDIIHCIQEISEGRVYFTPFIQNIFDSNREKKTNPVFTTREIELITLFAQGNTVDQTADALNLSPHTVATHRKKMFRKTKSTNISELLAFARKLEII